MQSNCSFSLFPTNYLKARVLFYYDWIDVQFQLLQLQVTRIVTDVFSRDFKKSLDVFCERFELTAVSRARLVT